MERSLRGARQLTDPGSQEKSQITSPPSGSPRSAGFFLSGNSSPVRNIPSLVTVPRLPMMAASPGPPPGSIRRSPPGIPDVQPIFRTSYPQFTLPSPAPHWELDESGQSAQKFTSPNDPPHHQPFLVLSESTMTSTMHATDDFHCFRADPVVRWQGIARVLETDPSAWDWALENIARWLSQGRLHPAPLIEWQHRLLEARHDSGFRQSLLQTMRTAPADVQQDQLRSCSPFIGGPFRDSSPSFLSS